MSNPIHITCESPSNPTVQALLTPLLDELARRYPEEGTDIELPTGVDGPLGAMLVAWQDGVPIGCGAIRPLTPSLAEVKRMYVAPPMRQRGVGRLILQALVDKARQLSYQTICLETGIRQPEAMRLYESAGFHRVECYGEYANNKLSVCYRKRIQ